MSRVIYTVGHSNMPPEDFIDLLDSVGVDLLYDVRSHPTSRLEHFHMDAMQDWLPMEYKWLMELGGWRDEFAGYQYEMLKHAIDIRPYLKGYFPIGQIKKNHWAGTPEETDRRWTSQGFYDYAWFMTIPEYWSGIERLLQSLDERRTPAIMCAEGMWWKCHRAMIADSLIWLQNDLKVEWFDVQHLQPKLVSHRTTIGNRLERYLPDMKELWRPYH